MVRPHADEIGSPDTARLRARWDRLRPHVGVGAVFILNDAIVNPNFGSTKSHPYLVLGGIPPATDSARVALGRFVQLSCRMSYDGQIESDQLGDSDSALFSKSGCMAGLDRNGVFDLRLFTVLVSDLARGKFLGYLPRELAEQVVFRATGRLIGVPYPPVGSI